MSDYSPSQDAVNQGRNLIVDRTTVEVWEELRRREVDALLLKGPTLARWLYRVEHARTYSDTDLLVAPDAVDAVEEVLVSLGFELPPIYSDEERPGYEHAWVRRRDGVRVDLHWSLVGAGVEPAVTWSVMWREAVPFELHGTEVTALSEAGRALHVALHAAQHGDELGSAMDDLERAVRAERSAWTRAHELALSLDAVHAFSAGLRLDARGAEIADDFGLPKEVPLDVAMRAAAVPPHALSLQWFLSQKGLGRKVRLIAGNLFPPPRFMREWSPVARKGKMGLLLAYLWRPFSLLARLALAAAVLKRSRRVAEQAQEEGPV